MLFRFFSLLALLPIAYLTGQLSENSLFHSEAFSQALQISLSISMFVAVGMIYLLKWRVDKKTKALKESEFTRKQMLRLLHQQEGELADYSLSVLQNKQFLLALEANIKEHKESETIGKSTLDKILNQLRINKSVEKEWEEFNRFFGNCHKEFYESLKSHYPFLNASELRHCALVKMNLTNKESSEIMGVEPKSIKMARYRIKKKMGLSAHDSLEDILYQLTNEPVTAVAS